MDSPLQIIALKFLFSVLLWVQSSAFGTGAGKFSEQFAKLSSNCLFTDRRNQILQRIYDFCDLLSEKSHAAQVS